MSDEAFMRLAIARAREGIRQGQPPFAACLVRNGKVLACVHNTVWQKQDVTAHAETDAIREACAKLGTVDLSGSVIYSTCEPCAMCFTACHDARIDRIVFGVRARDAEDFGYLGLNIPIAQLVQASVRPLAFTGDVLREECLELFRAARPRTGEAARACAGAHQAANGRTSDSWATRCLHHCFEDQAAGHPDAVAVSCSGASLTYRELNARANQLARYLRARGTRPDGLVALAVPRSVDTIVGILGILKAGAGYVHLDPAYPRPRLQYLLQDCRAPILVTCAGLGSELSAFCPSVVLLDHEAEAIRRESEANLDSGVLPGHLCYVMYTSGSTGKPKGVLVTHGNVSRLFPAMREHVQFDATDVWTLFHSASFGYSVWEIWGALAHGGRLVIVPPEVGQSADAFHELVCRERVTVLSQTPSAFRLFDWADESSRSVNRPVLRLIAFSGEALEPSVLRSWIRRHGDECPALLNTYAITETAGQVLCRRIRESDLDQPSRSVIGTPLSDVKVHMLDAEMGPVEEGSIGELYIGGEAVARGYLDRPELTQAKFLPDPFRNLPGARLYRTGDLARRLPGGEIEFVGRNDQQIKIRGYRVEPAEIETILREHEGVRDALVVARNDHPGENYLAAYVVPSTDTPSRAAPAAAVQPNGAGAIEFWPSNGEYLVYDDFMYYLMGQELSRRPHYRDLLARHVRNKVVADVGAGQDAILARMCVEAGARKVYAVELLDDAARRARAVVHDLGLQDRIEVLAGDAREIAVPEPVDFLVAKMFGNIGSAVGIVPILNRARRWLRDGGSLLLPSCTTKIAVASLPEAVRRQPRFGPLSSHYVKRIFDQAGQPFDVRLCVRNFPPSQIVSNVAVFEELDFSRPLAPEYDGSARLEIRADGVIDGFLLWGTVAFEDGGGVDYLQEPTGHLPVFVPVFDPGVPVSAGDVVQAQWTCRLSANGVNPDYALSGRLVRYNGPTTEFAFALPYRERAWKQSPFYERLFTSGLGDSPRGVAVRELAAYLRERLPEYLVPRSVALLEKIPLTVNGKVDFAALPPPRELRPQLGKEYAPPRTGLEKTLVDVWEKHLGIDGIGINDSFIELGAKSLTAIQLVRQIGEEFRIELTVRTLFDCPTIAELALAVERMTAGQDPESLLDELEGLSEAEAERLLTEPE